MLRQDKIWVGGLTGLLFPLFIFVILFELNELLVQKNLLPGEGIRLQFICIVSVIANVIIAGAHVRNEKDNALRGIIAVTFLYVFGIVIYFHKTLLGG